MSKVNEAIQLAAKLHAGQFRDGDNPLPYVVHPIEVLSNLRYVGGVTDEDMLVAAALHDTIEESAADLKQIEKQFGPKAAGLVKELTRKEPSEEEIEGMTAEEIWQLRAGMLLEEIAQMLRDAQAIKLADRLSNVKEAFRAKKGHKLERYLDQSKKILKTVPKDVNPGLWEAINTLLKEKK